MNIVAPAGNYEKLEAAIKAGANEVYFGLKGFGARRNNQNLNIKEILDKISAHHYVKCVRQSVEFFNYICPFEFSVLLKCRNCNDFRLSY